MSRETPTRSLHTAAAIFDFRLPSFAPPSGGGGTIVEIGSLHHEPGTPEAEVHGASALVWLNHTRASAIYTVDIDPVAIDCANRHGGAPGRCGRLRPVLADGITFLRAFSGKIDLLYLDAWDVSPDPAYQDRHFDAYCAALPHLHSASLVLIDDTDFPDLGKGRLVIPEARRHGHSVWWTGRQTMMGPSDVSFDGA